MSNTIQIELVVDDKGSVKVKDFGRTVAKAGDKAGTAQTKLQKVAKASGDVARGAAAAAGKLAGLASGLATVAGAFVFKESVGEFKDFESALADLGKVTDESLEQIKKKIMELPPEFGSATDMLQGYYQVISAGVEEPKAAMDTLIGAAQLAKTAHLELAPAVEGLTSVMDAFGTEVNDAADFMQTLEKTGKTTVGNLIPVIGSMVKPAAELGLSMEELGGAFAAVTTYAGGTERAATQVRGLLMKMINPTKEMTQLFQDYGSVQNAIKELGFEGVLEKIRDATQGNQDALFNLVGEQEAFLGIVSTLSGELATYNSAVTEQKDRTGEMAKAWEDYKETLSSMWDTFKNTVGKQAIEIGEKLAPAIKDVLEKTGDWLQANRDLITAKVAGYIEDVIKRVQDLGMSWGDFFDKVEGAASGLAKAFNAVWGVFDKVGKFIGEAAGAVMDLYDATDRLARQAWYVTVNLAGDVLEKMGQAKDWLSDLAGQAWSFTLDLAGDVVEGLEGAWALIKDITDPLWEAVVDLAGDLFDKVEAAWDWLKKMTEPVWKPVVNLAGDVFDKLKEAWDWVKRLVEKPWQVVVNLAGDIWDGIKRVGERLGLLEKEPHTVKVDVDTSGVDAGVSSIRRKVEDLDVKIRDFKPPMSIDPRPAEQALDRAEGKARRTHQKIEKLGTKYKIDPYPAEQTLKDLEGSAQETKEKIEKDPAKIHADAGGAKKEVGSLRDRYEHVKLAIEHAPIKVDIDYSSFEAALETMKQSHKKAMLEMAHEQAVMLANTAKYAAHTDRELEQIFAKRLADQRKQFDAIERGFQRLVERTSQPTDFNVNFWGTGSSRAPLTEKLLELQGKAQSFASAVDGLNPDLTVRLLGAGRAKKEVASLRDRYEHVKLAIEHAPIKMDIDYSSFEAALETTKQSHKKAMREMAHEQAVMLANTAKYAAHTDRELEKIFAKRVAYQRKQFDAIERRFQRLVERTSQPTDFNVNFWGTGSSRAPLTEKLLELQGKAQSFASAVDGLNPDLTVRLLGAGVGGTQPLSEAVDAAYGKLLNFEQAVSNLKPGMVVKVQYLQDLSPGSRIQVGPKYPEPGLMLDTGTGPEGLPATGWFYGHKGEIVKNPQESDAERRGRRSGDIHVTVAPRVMVGDRAAARQLAMIIQRELQELGVTGR